MRRLTAAVLALAGSLLLGPAQPAGAAGASVAVSGKQGAAAANADGPTTLRLAGSGFQSIQGGFGGIYVLFGSVSGNWRPSAGGVGGRDFLYVPDVQAKDNAGREKFVAFPGSETAASANGGAIAADGSWSTTLEVPGAVFEVEDASGAAQRVDCREVQCGVITIGAHGVVNANNETFTPVSFAAGAAGDSTSESTSDSGTTAGTQADGATGTVGLPAGGQPTVGVDATTAVAGHALVFTARGFSPGEQVTAVLDDGEVAVGPLTAGRFGEVAATMPLAVDLRVGSHTLTVTGAASGAAAEAMLTVRRDPSLVEASEQASVGVAEVGQERSLGPWQIAVVIAAIVFALVLAGALAAAAASRRSKAKRWAPASPLEAPARDPWADGVVSGGGFAGPAPGAPAAASIQPLTVGPATAGPATAGPATAGPPGADPVTAQLEPTSPATSPGTGPAGQASPTDPAVLVSWPPTAPLRAPETAE
ncbi:MAG: hypothetical protein LBS27_09630 [Bifidobacteriaceae bacterium]|jgi:hypothetical protein|nr:hypothetical protein [Bifidobacteriaceae bacterium]